MLFKKLQEYIVGPSIGLLELAVLHEKLKHDPGEKMTLTPEEIKQISSCVGSLRWILKMLATKGCRIDWLRKILCISVHNDVADDSKKKPDDEGENPRSDNSADNENHGHPTPNTDPNQPSDDDSGGDLSDKAGDSGDETSDAGAKDDDPGDDDQKNKNNGERSKPKKKRAKLNRRRLDITKWIENVFKTGAKCIKCNDGRLYPFKTASGEPRSMTIVTFNVPFIATKYIFEDLRCNVCNRVFKAELAKDLMQQEDLDPEYQGGGGGGVVYGSSARIGVAFNHFFSGQPYNRVETTSELMNQRIPKQTQFNLTRSVAQRLEPMYEYCKETIANQPIIHGDDISNRILAIPAEFKANRVSGKIDLRTGCHSSVILGINEEKNVPPLINTGIQHTGEVLDSICCKRVASSPPPIVVGDSSKVNAVTTIEAVFSGCWQHLRTRIVDLGKYSVDTAAKLTPILKKIFKLDRNTHHMEPAKRLEKMQGEALPLVEEFYEVSVQEVKNFPPNSKAAQLLNYGINNHETLKMPFIYEGIPLTNNIAEWCTYLTERYKSNSRFYNTQTGADIGDIIQTLILFALLNNRNPYRYLHHLYHEADYLKDNPAKFLPWALSEDVVPKLGPHSKFSFSLPQPQALGPNYKLNSS